MRAAAAVLVVALGALDPAGAVADGHLAPTQPAVDRLRAARSIAVLAPDVPMAEMVGFSNVPVRRPEWDGDAGEALAAEVREILALFRSCAWVAAAGRDGPVLQQIVAGCVPLERPGSGAGSSWVAPGDLGSAAHAVAVLARLQEARAWAAEPELRLVGTGTAPASLDGRPAIDVEAVDAEDDPARAPMRARIVASP